MHLPPQIRLGSLKGDPWKLSCKLALLVTLLRHAAAVELLTPWVGTAARFDLCEGFTVKHESTAPSSVSKGALKIDCEAKFDRAALETQLEACNPFELTSIPRCWLSVS